MTSVNAELFHREQDHDDRCPQCQSASVEWDVVIGFTYIGEVEYEQEADVATCRDCGARWAA